MTFTLDYFWTESESAQKQNSRNGMLWRSLDSGKTNKHSHEVTIHWSL